MTKEELHEKHADALAIVVEHDGGKFPDQKKTAKKITNLAESYAKSFAISELQKVLGYANTKETYAPSVSSGKIIRHIERQITDLQERGK